MTINTIIPWSKIGQVLPRSTEEYGEFQDAYPPDVYPDGVTYKTLLDFCSGKSGFGEIYGERVVRAIGYTADVWELDRETASSYKPLVFPGSIKSEFDICALDIFVGGDIESDSNVESLWGIVARGFVRAKRDIIALGIIEVGGSLTAGGKVVIGGSTTARTIKAGADIWANAPMYSRNDIIAAHSIGTSDIIEAGGTIQCGEKSVIVAGYNLDLAKEGKVAIRSPIKPDRIGFGEWERLPEGQLGR